MAVHSLWAVLLAPMGMTPVAFTGDVVGFQRSPAIPPAAVAADFRRPIPAIATAVDSAVALRSWAPVRPARVTSLAGRTQRATGEADQNVDGTPDFRWVVTTVYDSRGNPLSALAETDLNADGAFDQRDTDVRTYDEVGNLLSETSEMQRPDGTLLSRTRLLQTFDDAGRWLHGVAEYDFDGDGAVDSRSTIDLTYDGEGRPVMVAEQTDGDGDGIFDQVRNTTLTYDANGRLVREVDEYGSPTVIGLRMTRDFVYDFQGGLVYSITDYDDGADGVIDRRETYTLTIDGANSSHWVFDRDDGADGVVDHRVTTRRVFDPGQREGSEVSDSDSGADGTIEVRFTREWRIDESGYTIFLRDDTDQGADGKLESRTVQTYLYDAAHRLLRQTLEIDEPLDGIIDHRERYAANYDAQGDLVRETVENDSNGDGVIDYRGTITYQYDGVWSAPLHVSVVGAPNPFRDHATLRYSLSRLAQVSLRIYDLRGRLVRTLEHGTRGPGEHRVDWDGRDDDGRTLPSGAYFARVMGGGGGASTTRIVRVQ